MKAHSIDFKSQLKELGRELRGIITYDNTTLEEEIMSITPHYKADILKSVMKQLDLELTVDIPLNTIINCQIGILVGNDYEMLNYGNYVVYNSEKQEDTGTYKITCYDKMLYSMKQNEDLGITYPITIKNYLSALGNKIGLSVANTTFYNQDMQIPSELYLGLEYTYRDILDEIAQATGSIICLNENDEILVKYPTQTNDTIDEEYLKDINVDFGQKYGVINSIVLSRSGESDNVYLRDEESVAQNGLTEVKIVDNQIMNFNNRSDYLQGILNALNGLFYYLNDFNSTGILYYEVGDLYNVQIGENTYQCLMLNDEVDVTTGIQEMIHTDMPEKSETDYSKADKTDMRINKTYLIVDKQNQTIESVVNNVTEQNNKISQITQTVDEINSKIQDIADITNYGESDRAEVELTDINESEPIMIKVNPIGGIHISYLYPTDSLCPSDYQAIWNRIIRFTRTYEEEGQTLTENIDYELPDDLLRYSDTAYDEFYLDYDSQTCQVIKRCAYDADRIVRPLGTEITTNYPYPTIALGEGNYTITLPGYNFGYLYVRLMAKNIYTTQFYTKVETNSQINQKADEITSTVSATYERKDEALTAYTQINQNINSINLAVGRKLDEEEFTSANIMLTINNDTSSATINADKISLNGKDIDMTAQDVSISSTNFNVDKYGNVTANSLTSNNSTINGGTIDLIGDEQSPTFNIYKDTSKDANYRLYATSNFLVVREGFRTYVNMQALNNNATMQVSYDASNYITSRATSSGTNILLKGSSGNTNIRNDSISTPEITCNGNIYVDDGIIRSKYTYDYEQVSNAPNLYITSNGNFRRTTNTSSKRYKKDIKDLQNKELNPKRLYDLPIKQFKYKEEHQPNKEDCRYNKDLVGFIAEDVAEIYPIATDYNENGEVENWNERYMIPAMLKLIQEQHTEIEQMKKEIEELKGGK